MRTPIVAGLAAGLVLVAASTWYASTSPSDYAVVVELPPSGTSDAGLAGGCKSSDCDTEAPELTEDEFHTLVATWDELSRDTLAFHGRAALAFLDDDVDAAKAAWMQRELVRDTAAVQFRITDRDGAEITSLTQNVPVGIKQHLHFDGLPYELEAAGTVTRVGEKHLWARF